MRIQAEGKVRIDLSALAYAQKVWESIDTPVSLSCSIMARHKEYAQLVKMKIDPLSYVEPESFALDYQSVKLLSKYPYLDTGIDTELAAREAFHKAESQCLETNRRFRLRESKGELFPSSVESVLSIAARKISRILGDVPSLDLLDFSFGPGAAYGVRRETSVYNKVVSTLECTYAFADKLPEFLEEFPGWIPEGNHPVQLLQGSQLAFVPKDAKTQRPICIEPLLNGLFQKGVGSWVRDRLHRFGVDLRDQSINQRLAGRAWSEELATVDFTSASDTISYLVVMDLLPFDWFEFLDRARSASYEDGSCWKTFQKFSSMGNAYTFELETLIFYALACASCEYLGIEFETGINLHVYGDDVILPKQAFDLFSEVTECCGFTVNKDKSFSEGPFFESCGHDFFFGSNVRPYLVKRKLDTLLGAFYAANTIRRIQSRILQIRSPSPKESERVNDVLDRFGLVHRWVVGRIPHGYRYMGPDGYGDGHLVMPLDVSVTSRCSRVVRHASYDAWCFFSVQQQALLVSLDEWPAGYALYGTRVQKSSKLWWLPPDGLTPVPSRGYAVRGRVATKKKKVLCSSEWLDLPYPVDRFTH